MTKDGREETVPLGTVQLRVCSERRGKALGKNQGTHHKRVRGHRAGQADQAHLRQKGDLHTDGYGVQRVSEAEEKGRAINRSRIPLI